MALFLVWGNRDRLALGYLEWRFADHVWRTAHPRLRRMVQRL